MVIAKFLIILAVIALYPWYLMQIIWGVYWHGMSDFWATVLSAVLILAPLVGIGVLMFLI